MLGRVKWWKQPPPIQKPVATFAPTLFIQLPFPSVCAKGTGTCEALSFSINRQSPTFQKTGGDNGSWRGLWTAWPREEGSPERRCFFLSLSFSYLNSRVSKFGHP